MVEQLTFNQQVMGSSPIALTKEIRILARGSRAHYERQQSNSNHQVACSTAQPGYLAYAEVVTKLSNFCCARRNVSAKIPSLLGWAGGNSGTPPSTIRTPSMRISNKGSARGSERLKAGSICLAQKVLELGEDLLDRVQIGGVFGQEEQLVAWRPNCSAQED